MLYKSCDRARTQDLMTLTQHAAEDGGGLQPDLRSALVLLLTVSVSFSWTGSLLVWMGISRRYMVSLLF